VIADKFGNVACFPERECSIQRRKQKVIEESPSVLLTEETRLKMQQQAADLCQKVGYHTAGTVEFLADNDQNFYFLEMNTRLQVEHPVTEEVTGEDLVELMLSVAAGNKLPERLRHTEGSAEHDAKACWSVPFEGWSMESRIYAEDPLRGFLPSTGNLQKYKEPTNSLVDEKFADVQRVRVDSGVFEGSEISMFYDPMISKLITFAKGKTPQESRNQAIELMNRALDQYLIRGLSDNICFLRALFEHPRFTEGRLSTEMLDNEYKDGFQGIELDSIRQRKLAGLAATMHLAMDVESMDNIEAQTLYCGPDPDNMQKIHFSALSADSVLLTFSDDQSMELNNINFKAHETIFEAIATDGTQTLGPVVAQYLDIMNMGVKVKYLGNTYQVSIQNEKEYKYSKFMIPKPPVDTSKFCLSPMPGTLISVAVQPGDEVQVGQEIAVVEAMKMQNILRSEKKLTVKKVAGEPGQVLSLDELIVEFD
jgi:propionyl-CoA carboxylase alpha chain